MDDTIEDGVSDRWFADHLVPLRDGKFGGDQSGFPAVAGDALVIMEDLDDPVCKPDIDLAADQAVRHGIEGLVDFDMVVGMNLCRLSFGIFEWRCRQGRKRVLLDLLEELTSGFANPPHRPVIEIVEKLADPHVEIDEAEEAIVSQPRQDPALNDENAALTLALSFGRFGRVGRIVVS
jgi:hypothetical protein